MMEPINIIVGGGIIILNLIPFILKKPRYLLLTIAVSFFMVMALLFLRN